jgi:hypothetical protein
MLKIAGFGMGFSGSFAALLASEVLSSLGEEGLAEARGEKGRSGWEILKGGAFNVLVGHFAGRLLGAPGGKLAGEAEHVIERAAATARAEVAVADASHVATAIEGGVAREVDAAIRAKGYVMEVEIVSDGERHIWRKSSEGRWCRFSPEDHPLCVPSLGAVVNSAAARRNIELDLRQAGVSAVAANKVGGRLVLDDVIAKMPTVESKSTELIRINADTLRGGDEFAINLASEYGIDDYIRYHIRAPGLGGAKVEGFPIPLAPVWMNRGASRVETFMRSKLAGGWAVSYKATRTTFGGDELRPWLLEVFEQQNKLALSRIANDHGRVERFLKSIEYHIEVYRGGKLEVYRASMETGIPPAGQRIADAVVTKVR